MQTTFKFFISCFMCLALILLNGCGDQEGTSSIPRTGKQEAPPTLTPAEQAEVDKYINAHGRDAIVRYLEVAVKDKNTDENLILKYLKYLVSQGANVNAKDKIDFTPLHRAAMLKNVEIAKFLVSKGADVHAKGNRSGNSDSFLCEGITPLYIAAANENVEVFKFLVAQGADFNAKCDNGMMQLHIAAYNQDVVATRLLISNGNGANVNAKSDGGETPLHTIVKSRHGRYVGTLAGEIQDDNWVRVIIAKLLVSNGADVEAKDSNGQTPLGIASGRIESVHDPFGQREALALYAALGGVVRNTSASAQPARQSHKTLSQAVIAGDIGAVKSLISQGANVNKDVDNMGAYSTPLVMAAWKGNIEAAKLLIAAGANVNHTNNDGETPLHMAVRHHNVEMVKFLVSNGANTNIKNRYGETPLESGKNNIHPAIAEFLSGRK